MKKKKIDVHSNDFKQLIESGCFYIDKTNFIREWWENGDATTLIMRPPGFGKSVNLSMLEAFFSAEYAGRGDLFEGLSIWEDEKYRELQGTYPVIFLSFALVKGMTFEEASFEIRRLICQLYGKYDFLLKSDLLNEYEKERFLSVTESSEEFLIASSLQRLSWDLLKYYGKKTIILLDSYDTPLREAFEHGYWKEMKHYLNRLLNFTFKGNSELKRGVIAGVTRMSNDDLNMLVVCQTSKRYETAFGFTEQEVFDAMEEIGIDPETRDNVRYWYGGYSFGEVKNIYEPWAVVNYLDRERFFDYRQAARPDELMDHLFRISAGQIKMKFEDLLAEKSILCDIEEEFVLKRLTRQERTIWAFMVAYGYLAIVSVKDDIYSMKDDAYELKFPNHKVLRAFRHMVKKWFRRPGEELEFK